MRRPLIIVLLLVASTLVGSPAHAQDLTDVSDACHEAGADARQCRGLEHLAHTAGVLCRDVAANDPTCASVDGTVIDAASVDAHEASWLARALAHQRVLDDDLPLQEELWPHTHNSYNADAYPLTFYGLDRNQIYTLSDQLRMGIRAIEIDLHWAHSTSGSVADGGRAVVACHGEAVPLEATTFHFGCGVNDPTLRSMLEEVAMWAESNPDEFLMIYLENVLDGDATAHARAAEAIEDTIGPLVYRTANTGEECAPLPLDASRAELADTGARVILVGNCGPGAWGDLVHVRGLASEVGPDASRWREGGLDHGDDYPAYPCTERRAEQNYARDWIRHWGDETGLSNGTGGGGDVTLADARNMVRCGVNMIGLDNLVPFDERLAELVWSWRVDEPSRNGCAALGDDGRFFADDCGQVRPFACFDGEAWTLTRGSGPWQVGAQQCTAQTSGSFEVPRNGFQNELLKEATAGEEVWVAYASVTGVWTPGS